MITEQRTSVGDKSCANDRMITDDVAVYLRHNQNYERGMHQALPFATHCDDS